MKIEKIRLEKIDLEDKTFMSRLDFDKAIIRSLAENIKELGLRNPIGLRPKGGKISNSLWLGENESGRR